MPLTHVRTFRVRHYECDAYGYVKDANYLNYMQEAAFDASATAGYDLARYQAMGRYWLVRETDVEYLHPLHSKRGWPTFGGFVRAGPTSSDWTGRANWWHAPVPIGCSWTVSPGGR